MRTIKMHQKKFLKLNEFGKEVYEKYGVCFHIPQKHTGKDINVWVERLVGKTMSIGECWGIDKKVRLKGK